MGLESLVLAGLINFSPVEMTVPKAMVSQCIVAQASSEHEEKLEFYRDIAEKMSNAIHKGELGYGRKYDTSNKQYYLLCNHLIPFKGEGDKSQFNVKFQYVCGPRGGAGTIRALFYLEPYDWYSNKAIDNLTLWLFSTEETKVSAKIYEINVNHAHKTTVHESISERMLLGDYLVENIANEPIFTLLNKIKVKKTEIKKFLKAIGVIGDVLTYWEEEEIKNIATKIAGDHVWLTKFGIRGFGKFDENVTLYPNTIRAPKLFEIEILEGAKHTVGFALKAESRDYFKGRGILTEGNMVKKSEVVDKAELNIDFYLYGSIKDEKFDEDEIMKKIEKSEEIKAREIEKREFEKEEEGEEGEEDIRIYE